MKYSLAPVLGLDWLLRDLQQLLFLEHLSILKGKEISLLFRPDIVNIFTDHLLTRISQELFSRLVKSDESQRLDFFYKEQVGDVFNDFVEEILASAECLLRLLLIVPSAQNGDAKSQITCKFLQNPDFIRSKGVDFRGVN